MRCKKSLTWGYLTVFGAALIHISFAYSSTIGNMNSYLVSYMNITAGETVWFHAVLVSGQAVAMPIGGLLELKIGFRPVVAIGSITCSAGVALSALTVSHGIGPFIVTYTVMFGLGMGLPYTVLFTLAGAEFGAANHLDNGFLSKVASCTTLFNVLGRVIWGLLCDHISFKVKFFCIFRDIYWALLFATFPLITKAGAFQPLFAVWVFLLFFTMAGHFVLLPGACSRIFGPKYMATTFGLLHLTSAPSALILSAIMSHFKIINEFNLVFFCCCGLCILITVVALNWDEEAEEGDDPGSAIFSRASTT
ncbi:unnamed protein product [Mesocestoides corti]|uniref:Major facilitator superfamily (MFS) profile domain-containing protein n=1 Tax=Mesocestoides corti TaxID=53468 RepID=A0A158QV10_MESCO|nr:unnamed protein product [Mesocestoides corti]